MRTFDAETHRETKQVDYPLPARCRVRITLRAGDDCIVSAATEDGQVQDLGNFKPIGQLTEKFDLRGFNRLIIDGKKPIAPHVIIRHIETEEPHDDLPVPERPKPQNILQQIRQTVRDELLRGRESFLTNNTGLQGYEIDDDDDGEFPSDVIDKLARKPKPAAGNDPAPDGVSPSGTADTGDGQSDQQSSDE